MIRGLYTAVAGMITNQQRHDAVTHDIANVNTPGYKQQQAIFRTFPEFLLVMLDRGGRHSPAQVQRVVGPLAQGVYVDEVLPAFRQGDLEITQNPLDFALMDSDSTVNDTGRVPLTFFQVQGPDGQVFYTRNGQFTQDAQGNWVTATGYYVLDEAGNPIRTDGRPFHVDDTGAIYYEGEEGPQPFRLGVVQVQDPYRMVSNGNGLFHYEGPNPPQLAVPGDGWQVSQQRLERSNVEPGQAMVEMMMAQRAYEANQKVVQAYDRTLDKAVNEIARV